MLDIRAGSRTDGRDHCAESAVLSEFGRPRHIADPGPRVNGQATGVQ